MTAFGIHRSLYPTERFVPRKILFVDDEPMIRELVKLMLKEDYEVDAACSGEEGLMAIQTRGPYQAVVSDLRLQDMPGAIFLRMASELAPSTPGLAVTGSILPDEEDGDGSFPCLAKPCDGESLRAAIDEAIVESERIQFAKARLQQITRCESDAGL